MRMDQLFVSCLDITEDGYHFKGHFFLNAPGKSMSVDLEALENSVFLEELRAYFELEESILVIKIELMNMVVEKAHIGSKIVEGENYGETVKKKKPECAMASEVF